MNSAGFVISDASPNADAAWEFVKYAVGPSGQARLAELGFAAPVLQSVAQSPVFLEQGADIDQQVYLDALQYAQPKPSFVGYGEWSGVVGDTLALVWAGDISVDEALDEIVPLANEVLEANR